MYLPIGILIALGWLVFEIGTRKRCRPRCDSAYQPACSLLSLLTWRQVSYWHTIAYVGLRDAARARESFQKALRTDPDAFHKSLADYQNQVGANPSAQAHFWLAIMLGQAGERDRARAADEAPLLIGQVPDVLLVFQANEIQQLCVGCDDLRHLDGPRLGVGLRIVDR